jgi:16S rRNA U516 pseudouridylate synthase RsuA-like enzyme
VKRDGRVHAAERAWITEVPRPRDVDGQHGMGRYDLHSQGLVLIQANGLTRQIVPF